MFTTNHKDRLDPALLRPGRMDGQLGMSYWTFNGFKILALNYLRVVDHPVFMAVRALLAKGVATPAEVAGELFKSVEVDIALAGLVKFPEKKELRD